MVNIDTDGSSPAHMVFGSSNGGFLIPAITITNNAAVTFGSGSAPQLNESATGTTYLNLGGGVLTVPGFVTSTGNNVINFNGGTL